MPALTGFPATFRLHLISARQVARPEALPTASPVRGIIVRGIKTEAFLQRVIPLTLIPLTTIPSPKSGRAPIAQRADGWNGRLLIYHGGAHGVRRPTIALQNA